MKIAVLQLFILIMWVAVNAQQYNFEHIGIEEGLPQNTVYEIFQDSRGYIWFGTDGGGLAKFDGINFKVYNKSSGLSGNVVRKIIEDSDENIWIATDEGISIFNGHSFKKITKANGLQNSIIVSLLQTDEAVWAGSSGGGLAKIKKVATDTFNIKTYNIDNHLSSNNIFDIYQDRFKRLWIATFGRGINVLTFSNDSITKIEYLNTNSKLPSDRIWDFEAENDSLLWASTWDNGAFSINISKKTINPEIKTYNTHNFLSDYRIWSILPGNKTWFATDKCGLCILDENGKTTNFTTKNGLPKNQAIKLFRDNEGSVWFSLFEEGVFRFMGDQFYHITEKEGLLINNINGIHLDNNGHIFLATDGDGIYEISNPDKMDVKKVEWCKKIPTNSFTDIETDAENNIWLSSEMGVFKYGYGKLKFFTETSGLISNRVNCLLYQSNNTLWCGTTSGISKITNDKIFNATLGDGLINEIQTIIEDNEGNVWCGTLNGLVKFHAGNESATTFDEMEGLEVKKINSLTADSKGNIWIGTFGGGIYVYHNNSKSLKPISLFANDSLLVSNNINIVTFIKYNTLLAGTDKGLCKILLNDSLKILNVVQYDNTNGYPGIETNKNAVTQINHKFWIANSNGITVFDPEAGSTKPGLPTVHITGLKINFEETHWAKTGNSLYWYNLPSNLELNYKQNNLVISFVGLYYQNPEKIKFKYRLLGLSDTWTKPTQINEEQYLGLQPGNYIFEVIASNELNQWTSKPAQFSFSITPPFWKTNLFYLSSTLLLIIIIVIYIKYRERQLKQDKIKLEAIVAERTCEVLAQKKQIEDKNYQITSSIKYAQRIQEALLPAHEVLKNYVNEYFILFKPRDMVSGDFYWISGFDNILIIAAADCTGHGVPGAFMSMLGISFLNEIVAKNKVTDTSEILNQLRNNVIDALKQRGEIGGSKDGMDLAICTLDFSNNSLQFSGAFNPLIIVTNNTLTEIKADKMPIGYYDLMEPFKKQEISIKKGDTLYLFSDGYVDQFGGPDGRKFMKKHFKTLLTQIATAPLKQQKEILNKNLEDWRGEYAQIDDIVVLGIKI